MLAKMAVPAALRPDLLNSETQACEVHRMSAAKSTNCQPSTTSFELTAVLPKFTPLILRTIIAVAAR